MSEPRTVVAAACGLGLALLLASGAAADAVAPVLDRELPDLDRGLPAVLDLDSGDGSALGYSLAATARAGGAEAGAGAPLDKEEEAEYGGDTPRRLAELARERWRQEANRKRREAASQKRRQRKD